MAYPNPQALVGTLNTQLKICFWAKPLRNKHPSLFSLISYFTRGRICTLQWMWLAKKEFLSDSSWNKRCQHQFSVWVLFQEACKGCMEPQAHFCQKRILCLAYLMVLGEKVSNTRRTDLLQWGPINKCSFITTTFYHCGPGACSLKKDVMLPHLSWRPERKLSQ